MFQFKGTLAASKSWVNRALILQHFNSGLHWTGISSAEDVQVLKKALHQFPMQKTYHLGQGGTSFRFFCFLASRYPGEWFIQGDARLLERPQLEIKFLLEQLGVQVDFKSDGVRILSRGWQPVAELNCEGQKSSQFISGLLLSACQLDFDFKLVVQKPIVSKDYLLMTLHLLQQTGITVGVEETSGSLVIRIPKNQKPQSTSLHAELDISSAFSLIAAGLIDGEVTIENWIADSVQPDKLFLDIFRQMRIDYEITDKTFFIQKQSNWLGCDVNLDSAPDLFPVLAVLCALSEGPSFLRGASQLKFKESDRLQKTDELLSLAGFETEILDDAYLIHGKTLANPVRMPFQFDPDHDHRMAMAAGLLKLADYPIQIFTPEVVKKSYPHFWSDIGLQP